MQKNQSTKVDLLELAANDAMEPELEVVRLGQDEKAIILFSSETETIDIHFCSESEINGYTVCNGPGCVLCRIGRKKDQRLLLPVYLPAEGQIGVLPVSRSRRPFALLPQLLNVLKAETPLVMFVSRNGAKYSVSTSELGKDIDGGEATIKQFQEDYEAGRKDLTSVYPKIDNDQLAGIEEIARMMTLKGIQINAGDQRS
ncbi:MAG: hypothetical protein R6V20_08780 [Desulfobia sp.]